MRLRRTVLKIPAKSSVSSGLPLNKKRSFRTLSESTLRQPLIPLDFISFSSNVYRKPGEGPPHHHPKVWQVVTSRSALLRARTNVRNPIPLIHLLHNSRTPPGVGVPQWWDSQSWLSFLGLSPVTERGPRTTAPIGPPVPLRRNPQSARITQVAQDTTARKHIRPGWCLKYRERTSGRQCQNAVPVASRSQRATRGSHSQEGLGPTF
jgi:hypothetical protein